MLQGINGRGAMLKFEYNLSGTEFKDNFSLQKQACKTIKRESSSSF